MAIEAWRSGHPEVQAYAERFSTVEHAMGQIRFVLCVFKIVPHKLELDGLEDGIIEEIGGMKGRILDEIARDVSESWTPGKVSGRIRGML